MRKEVLCPYCGRTAEFINSIWIYGRDFGMVYYCRPCDAFVGVHKGSDIPFGTLANAELRKLRKQAHEQFDLLWKTGRMSRSSAYNWLAQKMNKPAEKTHIAMFGVDDCKRVIELCEKA